MEYLKIIGGKDISGSVEISGAKNAALPLIACTILGKNEISIGNLPNVVDINTFLKLIIYFTSSLKSLFISETYAFIPSSISYFASYPKFSFVDSIFACVKN